MPPAQRSHPSPRDHGSADASAAHSASHTHTAPAGCCYCVCCCLCLSTAPSFHSHGTSIPGGCVDPVEVWCVGEGECEVGWCVGVGECGCSRLRNSQSCVRCDLIMCLDTCRVHQPYGTGARSCNEPRRVFRNETLTPSVAVGNLQFLAVGKLQWLAVAVYGCVAIAVERGRS
eukprot:SAG11_NODE_94_length_17057_cov_255.471754_2_plen_173_part_00